MAVGLDQRVVVLDGLPSPQGAPGGGERLDRFVRHAASFAFDWKGGRHRLGGRPVTATLCPATEEAGGGDQEFAPAIPYHLTPVQNRTAVSACVGVTTVAESADTVSTSAASAALAIMMN